jgi:hypothetical protein
MGEHGAGAAVQRDVLGDGENSEVYGGDGAALLVGHEGVAGEARPLLLAAPGEKGDARVQKMPAMEHDAPIVAKGRLQAMRP